MKSEDEVGIEKVLVALEVRRAHNESNHLVIKEDLRSGDLDGQGLAFDLKRNRQGLF